MYSGYEGRLRQSVVNCGLKWVMVTEVPITFFYHACCCSDTVDDSENFSGTAYQVSLIELWFGSISFQVFYWNMESAHPKGRYELYSYHNRSFYFRFRNPSPL